MTASVVAAIAPKLEPAEIARASGKPTQSLVAYDCYLRAIANLHRGAAESSNDALQLFHRAIELDPDFSSAYGMAAWCHLRRMYAADSEEHRRRVITAAEREASPGKPFLGVPPRIPASRVALMNSNGSTPS